MIRLILLFFGSVIVGLTIKAGLKKGSSAYRNMAEECSPMEGKKVRFVEDENEAPNADGVCGRLEAKGPINHHEGPYEKYLKRGIDIVLSLCGLILHDRPTHILENPEKYITRSGKFIRRDSLDELPQIRDIFIGNMSVIGPRPALWNQDLLTAERDKYGADDIKPGLADWARINGRDELEITDKARLDGVYVEHMGIGMDIKCYMGALGVVGKDSSVVEGRTGKFEG